MLKVMFWTKYGYRKKTRAYVIAESIIKRTESSIRIQIDDKLKMTIKLKDLISIEEVED